MCDERGERFSTATYSKLRWNWSTGSMDTIDLGVNQSPSRRRVYEGRRESQSELSF